MSISSTLRKALASHKKETGASYADIALATQLQASGLNRFAKGKQHLDGSSIDKLADHLGFTLVQTKAGPKIKRKGA